MYENNDNKNIVLWDSDQSSQVNSINSAIKKKEVKRRLILSVVERDPGIRYKALLRQTGLANGSLSWNIKVLAAQKKLFVFRPNKGVTHFYPFSVEENTCCYLTEIRRRKAKEIILVLLGARNGHCTVKEISIAIKRASSTTCWHLNRMLINGIVFKKRNKTNTLYSLHNRDKILNILPDY